MTLQAAGILYWPAPLLGGGPLGTTMGINTLTLDSTTDAVAYVGRSTFNDTITTVYFRTGTIPASGGDDVDVRIETVSNGRPSGTLWAANTNKVVTIADSDDQLWKTATLTSAATVTPGQEFAIVIASSAGTPNIVLLSAATSLSGFYNHYPLFLQNATGSYAAPAFAGCLEWIVQLGTAGIVPLPGLLPLDGNGTISAISTSGTEEIAMHLQVPFACRVIGMRAALFNITAGADFTFSIWDSTDNPGADPVPIAQATAEDGDFALSTTQDGYVDLFFPTPATLSINTTYYAGVRADTANALNVGQLSAAGTGAPANAIRGFPIPAAGQIYSASRDWAGTDPGAWSPTTTLLPLISLIIDQLDDGAGASGGGLRLAGHGGLAA